MRSATLPDARPLPGATKPLPKPLGCIARENGAFLRSGVVGYVGPGARGGTSLISPSESALSDSGTESGCSRVRELSASRIFSGPLSNA